MQENYQKIIKAFNSARELDDFIASFLIQEFSKPGLVLLPVGKTFEEGIYPKVNDYFKLSENKFHDGKEELYKTQDHQANPDLYISHLDELINEKKNSFSNRLKSSLPNLIKNLDDRFYAIDIDDIESFERFIRRAGGPRLIILGLGANPDTAHVGFMGEEYINTATTEVTLSESAAKEHNCPTAITIGADIFQAHSLEAIIVVAKGKSKALSLKAAFGDADSGLGYLIHKHSDKLKIYTDHEAIQGLRH